MLVATGSLFAIGVALFVIDFFRYAPRFLVDANPSGQDTDVPPVTVRSAHA
jgi:nitric oxide reductase subunit B